MNPRNVELGVDDTSLSSRLVSGGVQKVANSHQTIGVRHRGPSDLKGPKNAPGVPRTHHPQAHAKKSDATALCCVSCAAAK